MMFTREQLVTEQGKVRTKTLFYEFSYSDDRFHIFTTKDEDIVVNSRTLVSLKKLYISICTNDPTEYTFAETVFGQWEIWETIKSSPFLKTFVAKWKREVEIKIKSKAIKAIHEEMETNGRSSFTAAKLLLERGWIEPEKVQDIKTRKRKEEEKLLDDEAIKSFNEDADRLGLTFN